MDTSAVAQILENLTSCPAGNLESQTLEFKGWCRDEKELSREVSDTAVCLANAEGGLIIVGVDDKRIGAPAISRCPYTSVTVDWIRARIRELTKPPVPCQVYRLGDLLENLGGSPAGDLFIIEASKTTLVSGHRTNRGVSLVRADKECRPDYFVDKDDYSDVWLSHLNCNELHDAALQAAAKIRETVFPAVKLHGNRPIDHLGEIGLIRPMEETSILGLESFVPSMASLLLFGKEESLKAEMPSAETVVAIETAAISPLTSSNWYGIAQALQNYVPLISDELAKREMPIPEDLIRELVLNAYLHRCYRTPGPLQIRIRQDEIEIQNPGGLLGSLTIETLIYAPPIYRNFKLADAARQFGYCEKAGSGIDKVYFLSVANGLEFPVFISTANSFSVIIRTKRDEAFAKFMKDFSGSINLSLPDMIVIRVLRTRIEADMMYLAKIAQRPVDYMEISLRDLERRNITYKSGNERYKLTEHILDQMARYDDKGQLRLL